LTLGLILMVALAAGALWAAGTEGQVEERPDTTQSPDTELPDTSLPAEEIGLLCGPNLPSCNSGQCSGIGCLIDLNSCEFENLGYQCCSDNGTTLVCDRGETVWSTTCDCGSGPGPGFCEQTQTKSHYCS